MSASIESEETDEEQVRATDLIEPATGRPRLCAQKCTTCIYLPGNLMNLRPGALGEISDDARDTFVPCHKTLPSVADVGPAVCAGWYDGYGSTSETMKVVEQIFGPMLPVDPPTTG